MTKNDHISPDGSTGPACLLNAEWLWFSPPQPLNGYEEVFLLCFFSGMFNRWLDKNDVVGNEANIEIATRMWKLIDSRISWQELIPPFGDLQPVITCFKRLKGLLKVKSQFPLCTQPPLPDKKYWHKG